MPCVYHEQKQRRSFNDYSCVLKEVMWGAHNIIFRWTVLEATRSLFNIDQDRTYVLFLGSDISLRIWTVHLAGIGELPYVHHVLSWFTYDSEAHVANTWKSSLELMWETFVYSLWTAIGWWESAAETTHWFFNLLPKITRIYLQISFYFKLIGNLRIELWRLFWS